MPRQASCAQKNIRMKLFLINSNIMVFKYNFPLRFASAQWEGIQSLLQGGISCKVLIFNSRQPRRSYHNIYIFFFKLLILLCLFLQLSIGSMEWLLLSFEYFALFEGFHTFFCNLTSYRSLFSCDRKKVLCSSV